MEAPAHVGGREFDGKAIDAALNLAVNLINQGPENRALTVGEAEHLPGMVFPGAVLGNPELAATGVVDVVGEPAKGLFVVGRHAEKVADEFFLVPLTWDAAVKAASVVLAPSDFTAGNVALFVFTGGQFTIWAKSEAAGGAESPGPALEGFAIGTDFENRTVVLGEL